MASTFSSDLKLELMATGENSGTWGTKTNTNLDLVQQAIVGFEAIAITSTNTTLLMTDATISTARNAVLKFTGTITANCTVFVASGIEKTYIIENGTSGAFTLALNQVGGNSVIFGATDKTSKIVYLDGTNANDLGLANLTAPQTLTNKTLTTPTLTSPIIDVIDDSNGNEEIKFTTTASAVNELTVANAATGNAPEVSSTGDDTNIDIKITPKGTGKVVLDGIKYPNTDGSAGQLLSTDGSGNLSFITVSSEAQFIAGSLPLAATKSTTARTAVSISKATGEVGAYPVLNVFSSTTKTVTTTATVNYSLDGSFGLIVGEPNVTTRSLIGVFTPSNGTPVIGNTSIFISQFGATPTDQIYGFGIGLARVASDIFLCSADAGSFDGSPTHQGGSRIFTARVNTSGAVSIGNITTHSFTNMGFFGRVGIVNQNNVTTYLTGTGGGATTNAKVLTLDTNLTTINRFSQNQSAASFIVGGGYFNFGNLGDTFYFPTNNSVVFSTINATTRLFSVPVTISNTAANFFNNAAGWFKVSNTRWLADYQNATTLIREIATYDVNATTLAYTSIQSTTRLYSGMFRFIGTTSAVVDVSTALTTAVLDYGAGLGVNVNTLELSTNGEIKGYNVGTPLGLTAIDPYDYIIDPNTSNQIVAAFINTSSQYKNLIVNAASTDQFNYAGIATANDSTSPVTVIQNGIQDGYTGLSIGSTLFAEFNGNLTTVATNITAGVAVTSTQLQVRQVTI